MPWLAETHLQNTRERVKQNGSAAELLRQMYLDELKSHHAAFYEYGSFADAVGLCLAFRHMEQQEWRPEASARACLIDSVNLLSRRHRECPKYDSDVAKEIVDFDDVGDVFVELSASAQSMWHEEPSNYITEYSGRIELSAEDDDRAEIGTARAYVVHLARASDDHLSWFEVLDATSADTASYLSLLEDRRNAWSPWIQEKLEAFDENLLILDRIRIEPKFRGKCYGLYAADALIQTLGPEAGLVACVPAPYELLKDREPVDAHAAASTRIEDTVPEWAPAQKKLRAYWSLLGFQRVPKTDIFILSTALKQPSLEQAVNRYQRSKHESAKKQVKRSRTA